MSEATEALRPTWHAGMYGAPQDMYGASVVLPLVAKLKAATTLQVVTTVAELDALPVGSVVRNAPEDTERVENDDGSWSQGAVAELRPDITGHSAWFLVGSNLGFRSHQADLLPATILYAPEN